MRISDWSSDVCSSDLDVPECRPRLVFAGEELVVLGQNGIVLDRQEVEAVADGERPDPRAALVAGGVSGQRGNAGLMAELPAPEAVLRNALGPDAVEVGIHAGRGGHSTGFLSRLAGDRQSTRL